MFKSSLSDYRGAYILLSGTITTDGAGAEAAAKITEKRKKDVTITDYVRFSKCISNINNTKVDDAQGINMIMAKYNIIKYRENYSKTSGSLQQYYRDEPNANFTDSASFKSEENITGKSPNDGNTKNVKIVIRLK